MSAQIIPFPAKRIRRHPALIEALDRLALCDEYELSGDRIKQIAAEHIRPLWEARLTAHGGVGPALLRKDGEAEA